MITVSEAKALVRKHLPTHTPQLVSLEKACWLTAAVDVYAPLSLPPFTQASMDGYAISLQDLGKPLPLQGAVAAGAISQPLKRGFTMRILTGAMVPMGADTVVMQEYAKISPEGISFDPIPMQVGLNVRAIGSHIQKGEIALRKGEKITPAVVGHLAGLGISQVEVLKKLSVAILTTGNEVVQPGSTLNPGEIYNSNQALLSAALKEPPVYLNHVRDDQESLFKEIEIALNKSDLLLISGGISVGDYDYVAAMLERAGVKRVFHGVKQKPGKPLYFGTKGDKLIFGLPGNPASSLTCFYEYVSLAFGESIEIRLPLKKGYEKKKGLTHILKGVADRTGVEILSGQESYKLHSYTQANCLVTIHEESENIAEGAVVDVRIL